MTLTVRLVSQGNIREVGGRDWYSPQRSRPDRALQCGRADHPHDHHYHRRAHEYYCVLRGSLTLRIQQELVTIEAGTITEIPPQVCHSLHGRQAPYLGFTLRVPLALDDKVTC